MQFYGKSAKICLIIYPRKEIRAKFLSNLLFSTVSVFERIILLFNNSIENKGGSYWLILYIFRNFAKIFSFSAIIIWDIKYSIFFSIRVFFHERSRITRFQGKGEGISLTPRYYFNPLYRHLNISREITAETLPLHIASSQTWTRNLWLPSASHEQSRKQIYPKLLKFHHPRKLILQKLIF